MSGASIAPHRFYYLHNFQQALDWLGQRYGDLLDAEESRFLQLFPQLPQSAQALLVRMVMRKGPWFRASKLVYEEIPRTTEAAAPLLEMGWISADAPNSSRMTRAAKSGAGASPAWAISATAPGKSWSLTNPPCR